MAHASTFAPTGRSQGWSTQVAPGTTGAFEILSIDLEKKRIGVALLPEGSTRAGNTTASAPEIVPGARLTGKVERHEKFGVFVFLAPGRTGLIPMSETGITREADVQTTFRVGADVEVVVLEVDAPPGRRIRLSAKAVLDAREADEVREYAERSHAAPSDGFGSLADKLRGALKHGSRRRCSKTCVMARARCCATRAGPPSSCCRWRSASAPTPRCSARSTACS